MKFRSSFYSLILLIAISLSSRGQDTVLLFHPTAYNMEIIQKLADADLFNLEGYHVLGVYHPGESYDYSLARAYIELQPGSMFSLEEIGGSLEPENIYRENPASQQFTKLFKSSRGALFMGGPDIPPLAYNEEVHLLTQVTDPYRHYMELSFIFHLLGGSQNPDWIPYLEENPNYLINGICLGMQSLNVATGGSLVQDIPTELYGIWLAEDILALPSDQMHRNYLDYLNTGCEDPTSYHFHRIVLEADMILTKGINFNGANSPLVLSSHHQAIEELGLGWKVAATSMDGKIIEAIQHGTYPHVLGIQFHPEKPGLFDPSIEHPESCNSTINFQKAIENTDSFLFHVSFWKQLGQFLQQNRKN